MNKIIEGVFGALIGIFFALVLIAGILLCAHAIQSLLVMLGS